MKADEIPSIWLQVSFKEVNERAHTRIDAINNHIGWYITHSKLP
ncbi:hypothetical protein ACMZZG_23805 [Pseudocitrobacter faecalis]